MFDPATKLEVLYSNVTGPTKPRKGSQCYFCFTNRYTVLGPEKVNLAFSKVYFTRYGFEQKNRLEFKSVLFVFPKLVVSISDKDLTEYTNKFLKYINSNDFKNEILNDKKNNFYFPIEKELPIIVARPCLTGKITDNEKEFQAYCRSLTRNNSISHIINKTISKGHYKILTKLNSDACITLEILNFVQNISKNKNFLLEALKQAPNKKEFMIGVINFLRSIEAFTRRDFVTKSNISSLGAIPIIFYKYRDFYLFSKNRIDIPLKHKIERSMHLIEETILSYKNN